MRAFRRLLVLVALVALPHGLSWSQDVQQEKDAATQEVSTLLDQARSRLERIGLVQSRPGHMPASSVSDGPCDKLMAGLPSGEERYDLLDEVEQDLRKVISIMPSAEAYHLLGLTLLYQLDPGRAAASFRIALELDGPSQEHYNYLVTALMEAGRLDEARKTAEEYMLAFPQEEIQGLAILSNIALYAMDAEAMAQAAQRMLELDPHNLDALIALAGAEAVRGNWEEAERKFQDIAASHPEMEEELELLRERLFVMQP